MQPNVFISYSHEDQYIISELVELMKIVRRDLVFQDSKDIYPGEKWEDKINYAIDQSKLFVIFWCKHSNQSDYVKKEYQRAILNGKDILPVLIDRTPLIKPLSDYQWLNFCKVVTHDLYVHGNRPYYKDGEQWDTLIGKNGLEESRSLFYLLSILSILVFVVGLGFNVMVVMVAGVLLFAFAVINYIIKLWMYKRKLEPKVKRADDLYVEVLDRKEYLTSHLKEELDRRLPIM